MSSMLIAGWTILCEMHMLVKCISWWGEINKNEIIQISFYFLARAAGNRVLYKMHMVVKYISQLLSSSKRRRGFTLQRNIILECKQIVFSVMSKYISQLAAAREEAVSPNATHSPPFLLQFFYPPIMLDSGEVRLPV